MVDNGKRKNPPVVVVDWDDVSNQTLPSPGRPKTTNGSHDHYLDHGGAYGLTYVPRCRVRGCINQLRMDQLLACSDECAEKLIHQAKWTLAILQDGEIRIKVE